MVGFSKRWQWDDEQTTSVSCYQETDWDKLTSNASYCDASRGAKCHFYDITAPQNAEPESKHEET